jgi:hypothetical protein
MSCPRRGHPLDGDEGRGTYRHTQGAFSAALAVGAATRHETEDEKKRHDPDKQPVLCHTSLLKQFLIPPQDLFNSIFVHFRDEKAK